MVFAITRLAPGGPLEQAMMQMQQVSEEGGGGLNSGSDQALSEDQLEQMKRLYGFDKPHWEAYLIWLGVLPRETEFRQIRFIDNELELAERVSLPSFSLVELDWDGDGYLQRQEVPSHLNKYINFSRFDHNRDGEIDGLEADTPAARIEGAREKIILQRDGKGGVRLENYFDLLGNWKVRMKVKDPEKPNRIPVAELYMTRYEGVLQGNFGQSTRYGEPVLSVITDRLPVSTYFGLLTFLITYLVCIPLGYL
jgi:microcin C transport system permease protein